MSRIKTINLLKYVGDSCGTPLVCSAKSDLGNLKDINAF